MQKVVEYQNTLQSIPDQEQFLRENSCLPGPRANLELLYAFIEISSPELVQEIINRNSVSPVNDPEEFIECCAVAACGKHILQGNHLLVSIIKKFASDNRWRIRESVAMALQHIGKYNYPLLKTIVVEWDKNNCYEKRAIVAGLCEPAILVTNEANLFTLSMLREITRIIPQFTDKTWAEYKTLVQALCYCWSVAVAANPEQGKPLFEELLTYKDKDVLKIAKENLKKNRLIKMDKQWTENLTSLVNK